MFFNRTKGVVGLDIGSATIKLVELKEKKGGNFLLQRIGVEPLSPEAIVDGSIMDSSLVVDAIQKLNEQSGVKAANFATSVSGHSVIIKKIELPAMELDELAHLGGRVVERREEVSSAEVGHRQPFGRIASTRSASLRAVPSSRS